MQSDRQKPVMRQDWKDLLFLHWRYDPGEIEIRLPPTLSLDTYDGTGWMGIVPFRMENIRLGRLPSIPGTSSFPELNLRTYVKDTRGRPGVWFFSLDAGSRLAVWVARTFFHLNYLYARMRVRETEKDQLLFRSRRIEPGESFQEFEWDRPTGNLTPANPDSLEHFLVERYRLFAWNHSLQKLMTGTVRHPPYQISETPVHRYSTRLFTLNNFKKPQGAPDSILAAKGFEVEILPMETF